MNTSITNSYLQQFRLRSARHKIRMQHADFEKRLRRINKEQNELYKQRRSLAWIDIHPPIMRGWKRYFILRDDVAASRHKAFFENLLQKINTTTYSTRKDFKRKKRKFGKKVYVDREQPLLVPDEYYIRKHKFSEKELSYFEKREVTDQWNRKRVSKYFFTEPWRFVLRIRPNLITQVQIKDVELEQRISQLDNYIERNNLKGKMYRLVYGRYQWWYGREGKPKEKDPLQNKSLMQILDACNEELL